MAAKVIFEVRLYSLMRIPASPPRMTAIKIASAEIARCSMVNVKKKSLRCHNVTNTSLNIGLSSLFANIC